MRALSIRQPWAWLIVNGHKPVENREWRTDYRGPLLIHAAKVCARRDFTETVLSLTDEFGADLPPIPSLDQIERGGIVGVVELVDIVTAHPSPYFTGPYAWVFANPRRLDFTPCKGALGLFHVPVHALRQPVAAPIPTT